MALHEAASLWLSGWLAIRRTMSTTPAGRVVDAGKSEHKKDSVCSTWKWLWHPAAPHRLMMKSLAVSRFDLVQLFLIGDVFEVLRDLTRVKHAADDPNQSVYMTFDLFR
jgi:hypothetical protein